MSAQIWIHMHIHMRSSPVAKIYKKQKKSIAEKVHRRKNNSKNTDKQSYDRSNIMISQHPRKSKIPIQVSLSHTPTKQFIESLRQSELSRLEVQLEPCKFIRNDQHHIQKIFVTVRNQ